MSKDGDYSLTKQLAIIQGLPPIQISAVNLYSEICALTTLTRISNRPGQMHYHASIDGILVFLHRTCSNFSF